MQPSASRRRFIAAASAAFTTSLFPGRVKGANDRVAVGYIGVGRMGNSNMSAAMREPAVQVAAVCDVYQPNMERTAAAAQRGGHQPRSYKDFRDVLADKSIDAVCISTPDHWHALMTVEACKAGKDVYVEKPVCTFVDEAPKMVEAARKYNRVVQAGTQSRSAGHIPAIREVIRTNELGEITFVRVWNTSLEPKTGIGNPPDSAPPAGLDWDLWLGPAPYRPYNQNRFAVQQGSWGSFRYFWDYGGGQVTDNGVHIVDLMQMAFHETAPTVCSAVGRKSYLTDNRETPDVLVAQYEYPEFIGAYEMRYTNGESMFGRGSGIAIHGTRGTMYFARGASYEIYAQNTPQSRNPNPNVSALEVTTASSAEGGGRGAAAGGAGTPAPPAPAARGTQPAAAQAQGPQPSVQRSFEPTHTHWGNFIECIRTRQRPIADIEYVARSTVTVLLANASYRAKARINWDPKTWTTTTAEARPFLAYKYRAPWKLEV